jgi:hypothetical protein
MMMMVLQRGPCCTNSIGCFTARSNVSNELLLRMRRYGFYGGARVEGTVDCRVSAPVPVILTTEGLCCLCLRSDVFVLFGSVVCVNVCV